MNEAAQTTASPAAIWAIVVIMPILAMILIIAPAVADSWQARVNRPARGAGQMGPAITDVITHTGALGEGTAGADMTNTDRTDAGAFGESTRGIAPGDPAASSARGRPDRPPACQGTNSMVKRPS